MRYTPVLLLVIAGYVAIGYEACKSCKMPNPFPPSAAELEVRYHAGFNPCVCGCNTACITRPNGTCASMPAMRHDPGPDDPDWVCPLVRGEVR